MSHLSYTPPEQVRAKLKTAFGREAFDRLNALGPRWVCEENQDGVYLSPTIETKRAGGGVLSSLGRGSAESFDLAVVDTLVAIQLDAFENNKLVVVNAYDKEGRAVFTCDKASGAFIPCKP